MTQSTYRPDNTRRLQLEGFIGSVCVGSTGRLGIVTHVAVKYGSWTCCGFGLDGKGVWTSGSPIEIARAEDFFNKLNDRFDGKLSYHDMASVDYNRLAEMVAEKIDRTSHMIDFYAESLQIGGTLEETRETVTSQTEAGADNALGLGASAEVVSPNNVPETD